MPTPGFAALVGRSNTAADVLRYFGFTSGSNWPTVWARCREEGISTSHFDANKARSKAVQKIATPLADVLIKNSSYSRGSLKRRLIGEGLLKECCFKCGRGPIWCEEPLVLILDHINGIRDDNRLENLRLVCPNCNSQLDTFAGRNISTTRKHCLGCGKGLTNKLSRCCRSCNNKKQGVNSRKIDWPSYEALQQRISLSNRNVVARELGVSETAVRKMLKRMSQDMPLRADCLA